jgi:hypothetical protein
MATSTSDRRIDLLTVNADVRHNLFTNSYYSADHRFFYVATPKVACTTMKWWFADLVGLTEAIRGHGGSAESTPDLVIHDTFPKVSTHHTHLPTETLASILSSKHIFSFALVRNPFARTFSAWQSKWLLRESLQIEPYLNAPFMNPSPKSAHDIKLTFEDFLRFIVDNEYPNILDPHLKPQSLLLGVDLIPYRLIGKIEEFDIAVERLRQHLGSETKDPKRFGSKNESLIAYHPELLTETSRKIIRHIYAEDFRKLNYDTDPPSSRVSVSDSEIQTILRTIEAVQARNERIGQMRKDYNSNIAKLLDELSHAKSTQEELSILVHQQKNDLQAAMYANASLQAQRDILNRLFSPSRTTIVDAGKH